jgi:hypothetical protein
MDAMLPLVSKRCTVLGHGSGGSGAMLYLIQIDPVHATPSRFMSMVTAALGISAVGPSHQVWPSLRR